MPSYVHNVRSYVVSAHVRTERAARRLFFCISRVNSRQVGLGGGGRAGALHLPNWAVVRVKAITTTPPPKPAYTHLFSFLTISCPSRTQNIRFDADVAVYGERAVMLVVHPSSQCDVCLDPYTWTLPAKTPHAIQCGHIFCYEYVLVSAPPLSQDGVGH